MREMRRGTLTWGPGLSNDLGSEASAALAAVVDVAAPVAVAGQMMVVAVAVGLMVVLVEDWCASVSPELGSRPPRSRQLSSGASEGGPN
jgi:hypothetical protein